MPAQDFVPNKSGKKAIWATAYKKQIDEAATVLGLSASDVAEIKDLCDAVTKGVTDSFAAQQTAKQILHEKNKQIKEAIKGLRKHTRSIKTNKNFTNAIGEGLGVISHAHKLDVEHYKPKIKVRSEGGRNLISFTKKGIEGAKVLSKIKGETIWQTVGVVSRSPYKDERPVKTAGVPEVREYCIIGMLRDAEIGQPSDTVTAMFEG